MKRKWLAVGIILLFVGTCILPTVAQETEKSQTSRGTWLYVGGSGPGNYTKIQDAIDNASDGDTVFVFSGWYSENVLVNKSLTLSGENRETTIIDANRSGCPVEIEAHFVTVSGFTLQNSGNIEQKDAGLRIKTVHNFTSNSNSNRIIGNKIINNNDGIYAFYTENNTISNNIIINNQNYGILFDYKCTSSIIQNNIIIRNRFGVCIHQTQEVQVIENDIENNSVVGIVLVMEVTSNDVKFNKVINNSIGIALDGQIYRAENNNIFSNTIADNDEYGLLILEGYFNKILRNNFLNNTIQASFFYWRAIIIAKFFFGRFLQVNKFYRNYWDDCSFLQVYRINGTIYWIKGFWYEAEYKEKAWYNYDWFPALIPYNI